MDSKIIQFYPWSSVHKEWNPLAPAKRNIAPYWKEMPLYHNNGDFDRARRGEANRSNVFLSIKHCMPYLDAMIAGYHYLLHTDVYVKINEEGIPEISWNSEHEPAGERILKEMPVPHGHYQAHFGWQMHWGFQVPDGYSVLITHPLNRNDLPFTTTSGIVDNDVYPLPGNISFHIKDNFSGVIPAGTPIMQIIPIKRENWSSVVNTDDSFFEEKLAMSIEKNNTNMAHYKKGYRIGMDYS